MRQYDLSPLYRSTIGFDRLFGMLDQAAGLEAAPGYPPYDIERTGEDAYRISIAVAGFAEKDLFVETRDNTLTVRGSRAARGGGRGPTNRSALSRHCLPLFRAPVPACRSCPGDQRQPRKRAASRRSAARTARGAQTASDPDWQRSIGGGSAGRRAEGRLDHDKLGATRR